MIDKFRLAAEARKKQQENAARLLQEIKDKLGRTPAYLATLFPYSVKLGKRAKTSDRVVIREWFSTRLLSVYLVNGDEADVTWDDNWKEFRFKDEGIAMEFLIRFL